MTFRHSVTWASLFAVLSLTTAIKAESPAGDQLPGVGGIVDLEKTSQTWQSIDFANDLSRKDISEYELVKGKGKGGQPALTARITGPNQAKKLHVPMKFVAGRRVVVECFVKGDPGVRAIIWAAYDGKARRRVSEPLTQNGGWKKLTGIISPTTNEPGHLEIIVPSSYGGKPGQGWVCGLRYAIGNFEAYGLDHVEDFPSLVVDGQGTTWLAVLARPIPRRTIRVYRLDANGRTLAEEFATEGMTGLGTPQLVALDDGCAVLFPAEQNDRFRIAWATIAADSARNTIGPALKYIDAGGSANVMPAVARSGKTLAVLFESNASTPRGIYASFVDLTTGKATAPSRLSDPGHVSHNPAIVSFSDGRLFAAWDSLRNDQIDLYGTQYDGRNWEPERRLTTDPRIERYPALAVRKDEVWLAWQAQSFQKQLVNHLHEQRVVVARLGKDGSLETLPDSFTKVSPLGYQLMRPRIAFDSVGRLWLTVRRSMGAHSGWQPFAQVGDAQGWSKPIPLWSDQGRWRPVSIAFSGSDVAMFAVQRDNLPTNWGVDIGEHEDWHGDVPVVTRPADGQPAERVTIPTEPLVMPETDFELARRIVDSSASLPSQSIEHAGQTYTVYYGDLHEHTDLSVCQRSGNPPAPDLLDNQRDIERLDFTAITDHGYNMDRPQWQFTQEQIRSHFDAKEFVTLLAEEWTSDQHQYDPKRTYRRYGHRNLIFEDPYQMRFLDSRDGDITPFDAFEQLSDLKFISVPHQLADTGNCPTDWHFHDEHHQPLAEIFQHRESYEALDAPRAAERGLKQRGHYLQDAWAQGIVIGVIASPDHGGGMGKAGVWAKELTRASLFEAFHARHTFGTSGSKMNLSVTSGESMMGDKVLRPKGSIDFHVRAVTDRPIAKVVVLRNNEPVHTVTPGVESVDFHWTDSAPLDVPQAWYYVRIERADEELAWSSPIWFFATEADRAATATRTYFSAFGGDGPLEGHAHPHPHPHPHSHE